MSAVAPPVRRRNRLAALLAVLIMVATAGCSLFAKDKTDNVSVFEVAPGQCFTAIPTEQIKAELSELPRVPCGQDHTMEAYATLAYANPDGTEATEYPGVEAMTKFAQGRCAQEFTTYVGISYLDSDLYFTYLMPSARSWSASGRQGEDRNVLCFITTTGQQLTASVKGTKQ